MTIDTSKLEYRHCDGGPAQLRSIEIMAQIVTSYLNTFDFDAVAKLMDDDIVAEMGYGDGYESEQVMYNTYCEKHLAQFGEPFAFDTKNPQV